MQTIEEAQRLTRDYASFSRSRSGLGNVLGGSAGLVSFAAFYVLGRGVFVAGLTVGLTLLWLVGKEVLRRRLYRPCGEAQESWLAAQKRSHMIYVGIITASLLGFAVAIVVQSIIAGPQGPGVSYLLFCLVTPPIAWRYLRTANELMVGFYLLFFCAVTSAGYVPDILIAAVLPLYALILIGVGLREHVQFQRLVAQLRRRAEVNE